MSRQRTPRQGRHTYFIKILFLFLAVAIVPVTALSLALRTIASAFLEDASRKAGESAARTFAAATKAIVSGTTSSLETLSASPEAVTVLDSYPKARAEDVSSLMQTITRESARSGNQSLAVVGLHTGQWFSARALPDDWDYPVYSSWGILREASLSDGCAAVSRKRGLPGGDAALICLGMPILGPSGEKIGFALAEIDRSGLTAAALSDPSSAANGAALIDRLGIVSFDLTAPDREGEFYSAPASGYGPSSGIYLAEASPFSAVASLPASISRGMLSAMGSATLLGILACAAAAGILALVSSRRVTRPVLDLSDAMARVIAGDLAVRVRRTAEDELGDLQVSFNDMTAELARLVAATTEKQELLREAELSALAARMNPHFLYNALNSIRSLAKLGMNSQIAETASSLGKLLRASAETSAELSSLGQGMELIRDYLAIEKIRYGQRMTFHESMEPGLEDCILPSLVLEPLAENALIHGLERKAGHGRLSISTRSEGGILLIEFLDDGPGMETAALAALKEKLAEGGAPEIRGRLGLLATNRRLRLLYGRAFGIEVDNAAGGGFRARLAVPLRRPAPCTPSS